MAVIAAFELRGECPPAKPRARRITLIEASVPESTSAPFDGRDGIKINSVNPTSLPAGAPKLVPNFQDTR